MASLEEQLGALYLQSLTGGQGETAGYGMMPPQPMQPVMPTPMAQPTQMAPIMQIHPAIQSAFQTALMNQAMLGTQQPPFNPIEYQTSTNMLPTEYARANIAAAQIPSWMEKSKNTDGESTTTTTPQNVITMTPINFGGLLGR
jgi:hypothetical protein